MSTEIDAMDTITKKDNEAIFKLKNERDQLIKILTYYLPAINAIHGQYNLADGLIEDITGKSPYVS